MISVVLICKDCGFHAGIISGTMQEIIILAVLLAFLWTQYQQITASGFEVYYYDMHVIKEIGLSSDSDSSI